MSLRRRPRGAAAALLVPAALVFALVSSTGASAAPAAPSPIGAHTPDYPTWQDVQNAKRNQAATAAEIDRIEGILIALENKAAALGKIAQIKAEEYAQARDALEAATQKVERLGARADEAQERADESATRAARLIAQLARTGGGDLTLGLIIGSASDTDQLLARLGTMNRLTESSSDILARAQFDQNLAESLADDAKAAEKVRKRLADRRRGRARRRRRPRRTRPRHRSPSSRGTPTSCTRSSRASRTRPPRSSGTTRRGSPSSRRSSRTTRRSLRRTRRAVSTRRRIPRSAQRCSRRSPTPRRSSASRTRSAGPAPARGTAPGSR